MDSSAVEKPAYCVAVASGRAATRRESREHAGADDGCAARTRALTWRMVHGRAVYMVAYGPRVYGNSADTWDTESGCAYEQHEARAHRAVRAAARNRAVARRVLARLSHVHVVTCVDGLDWDALGGVPRQRLDWVLPLQLLDA